MVSQVQRPTVTNVKLWKAMDGIAPINDEMGFLMTLLVASEPRIWW